MDRRAIEHLPDDGLKAIFKSLTRRDLRRLALTNSQFCDIIFPMLNAKTDMLLRRIPPAMELYRRLINTELRTTIRQLINEQARLDHEYGQLDREIRYLLQDSLKLYEVELAKKLDEIDARKKKALLDSQDLIRRGFASEHAIRMRHFHRQSERKEAEAFELESRAHRLKAEFHLTEASNSPTAAICHARLAELNLRAMSMCEERSRVQTDLSSNHETYVKYKTAYEDLRIELVMLSREANSD